MEKFYAIPQTWSSEYPNFNKHIRWNLLVIKNSFPCGFVIDWLQVNA